MQDIIARFKKVPSTCASDAMGGMNSMDAAIKPLQEGYVVCGRAFTVKIPAGDNLLFLKAIRDAKPGDVLVVDVGGYTSRAVAGDFIIGLAQMLGLAGLVADGVVRDVVGVKNTGFPVFCRGAIPAASAKHGGGQINVPISCGGVTANPGDIVVGDADGIVVIPQNKEGEILRDAEDKLLKDEKRAQTVLVSAEAAREYINQFLGN